MLYVRVAVFLSLLFFLAHAESAQAKVFVQDAGGALVDQDVLEAVKEDGKVPVILALKEGHEPAFVRRFATAKDPRKHIHRSRIKALQEKVKSHFNSGDLAGTMDLVHALENTPVLSARINKKALNALAKHPNVAMILQDEPVYAMLSESSPLVESPAAHALGYTGEAVVVAVIDTGIDSEHPGLQDDLVWEECFLSLGGCPKTGGVRASGKGSAEDLNGHGTHVSGIITSSDPTYLGIAPDAHIAALKTLDDQGHGIFSDVLAATDWATSHAEELGIRVINMSLGGKTGYLGECDDFNPASAVVMEAAASAGITMFAASGNSALKDAIAYPACLSSVISVGAVYDDDLGPLRWGTVIGVLCQDPETVADQVACFSNASSVLDLLAPGAIIVSTVPRGGTGAKSGTSMACPHAAAAAALILDKSPGLTPDEIRQRLVSTGIPVLDLRNGMTFPRINVNHALLNLTVSLPEVAREGDGLLQGQGRVSISETFNEDIVVSLVSSDPSELNVDPTSVVIAAGEKWAPFSLRIEDDSILDGTQVVSVTATVSGIMEFTERKEIAVEDNETAILSVQVPETVHEGDGVLESQGIVTVSEIVGDDVIVKLFSSNPSLVKVPKHVVIPGGLVSASFDLTVLDNVVVSDPETVTITASVSNWIAGNDSTEVIDNDPKYYVNDASTANDLWCRASGDDVNDGLTPDTPKATVQGILASYDLEPGDVVAIDTGTYLLSENVQVTQEDQGSAEVPVLFIASPYGVTFDRNSSGPGAYGWHLTQADRVEIRTAFSNRLPGVAQRWMKITGAQTGIYVQGADSAKIERVEVSGNASYGIYLLASNHAVCRNALVTSNGSTGLFVSGSAEGSFVNNTIAANGGTHEVVLSGSTAMAFRNNIIHAHGSNRGGMQAFGQGSILTSDYNLFHLTGGAAVGWLWEWYRTLLDWQNATGLDEHSLFGNPGFVDPEGEDWHLASRGGSYHEGGWTADAENSSGLDTGDPADEVSEEPMPNGGQVNLGAYGGTEQASRTPEERVLVLQAPNGDEMAKGSFVISWLAVGTAWQGSDTVRIEYSSDNGGTWNAVAASVLADDASGFMGYEWDTKDLCDGPYYLIRITSNEDPDVWVVSERWFTVHNGPVAYYVNDASTDHDAWCTAPGDDVNDGLTPATPKAMVQAVLSTFDLEPGDVIYMDTGDYRLSENIVVTDADDGSVDTPVSFVASPYGVTFDRGNTASSSYGWHLKNSQYVELLTAWSNRLPEVPQRWMQIKGARSGIFLQGANHCRVERVEASGNDQFGLYLMGSGNGVFKNNLITGNGSSGAFLDSRSAGNVFVNNTIARNGGTMELWLSDARGTVLRNNIVWANGANRRGIHASDAGEIQASDYNLFYVTGGASVAWMGQWYPTLPDWQTATEWDVNSLSGDPQFVDSDGGDWHLRSRGGSYHGGTWTLDSNDSPGLDAGDLEDDASLEPMPNGWRINVGAYGGTEQASKSSPFGPCQADLDEDGDVDGVELALIARDFGREDCEDPPVCEVDLDSDGNVEVHDLERLVRDFGRSNCHNGRP